MAITLSNAQLQHMQTTFSLDTADPDYAGMYDYIFKEVGDQMPADQRYWFEQAAKINEYLNDVENVVPTQSAYYIQQINKLSLGDSADVKIAGISNTIGKNVYQDIIDGNGVIPDLAHQVQNDIQAAIDEGGLTLSQWGGAFYYWDTVLPDEGGGKIGRTIASNGKDLEEFIELTSIATAKTIHKLNQGVSQLDFGQTRISS